MKTTIFKLLTQFCVLIILSGTLQAQNPAQILTPKYFKDFGSVKSYDPLPIPSTAVPLPGFDPTHGYNGFKAKGSQNIQVDAEGKIMFFIVDGYIFDRKGNLFGLVALNATNTGLGDGGFCETAIIPSPECGTPNTFFLLTTYKLPSGPEGYSACWDKIVISYDNNDDPTPDSYVLSKKINVGPSSMILDDLLLDKMIPTFLGGAAYHCNAPYMAASKVLTGNKRFVYVLNVATIFRFKIQNDQLVYDNYSLPLMPSFFYEFDRCQLYDRSEMELISMPNGDLRLAFPISAAVTNQDAERPGFATLDFNSTTGNVIPASLKTVFYNTATALKIKGAELSPDGSKLYLTHNSQTAFPSTLDMFDLTASNPTASRVALSNLSDFGDSQIESGMAGILLIPSTSQLYKIGNPNTTTPTLTAYQSLTGYTPNCPLSYCNPDDLVRYMQDQIDGENYSAYGSINFSAHTYTVSGTETWSSGVGNNPFNATGTIYIKESIVVSINSVLNINGLTLEFAPDARIIIESGLMFFNNLIPGGRLNLNNATLTSDDRCSANMWRGVEVRGYSNSSQGSLTNSLQGKVVMSNSVIKNAIKGVVALSYTKTTNGNNVTFVSDNTRGGGIIQATNSFFYNNQNDISLLSYNTQVNNLSFFNNCVFETNSLLNNPSLALENHITLSGVKGISILGCDFINSASQLFQIDKQGIGISASVSSFTVQPRCLSVFYPCTQFDRGQFIGLTFGIKSASLFSTLTFTCDRSIFKNNAIGIQASFSTNPSILRNSFEVREILSTNPIINQSAGIYLYSSNGYRVEENTFKEFDNVSIPNGSANSYGIVASNSGIGSNIIYKNTFSNLKIGGQSEGINGRTINSPSDPVDSEGKMSGLQWKCNTFDSPIYSHDLTVIDGIIDYNQGYIQTTYLDSARLKAANNKFSLLGENMNLEHDFKLSLSSKNILYVHTTSNNYVPDSYSGLRMGIAPSQYNGSNIPHSNLGCPSKIKEGGVIVLPPLVFSGLKEVKDPYIYSVLSGKNNNLITYLLTDTTLENGSSVLNELLIENEDKEFQILRAENQLYNLNYSLDEVLASNPNLSDDEKKLLSIKNTLNREGIDILKDENKSQDILSSLSEIIGSSKDVLLRKQAELIYSFSKPEDLTYYFLEDFKSKSMEIESNENQLGSDGITVYPNPASSELTFEIDFDADETLEAKVYSTLGTQIAVWSINKNKMTVDVSKLTNGIYIIQMTNAKGMNIHNIKFIKK